MLRHIFIGPARPGCTEAQLSEVVATLRRIPVPVPRVRDFSVRKTLDWSGTQAVVLIADFDQQDDWERYMREPKHLALGDRIKDAVDLSCMTVVQTHA